MCFANAQCGMMLMQMRNSKCGMRISDSPRTRAKAKCDWVLELMHATEGSRNAECGMMKNIASERADAIRTK